VHEFAGRVVDPDLARGQVLGGAAQGLGIAVEQARTRGERFVEQSPYGRARSGRRARRGPRRGRPRCGGERGRRRAGVRPTRLPLDPETVWRLARSRHPAPVRDLDR
jgi:Aerobic-type carbon monoxide dehydrogenase, large subunit CoxL/CutL homologs